MTPTPETEAEPTRVVPPPASQPSGRGPLGRLFRLVMILQSERFPNARELAERCEVSRRTIYRDLETLGASGVPVRYRPERQGYQISSGFFFPPVGATEEEALALLALARQWDAGAALGLARWARSGAIKLAQALPEGSRDRVLAQAEAFQGDEATPAGPAEPARTLLASVGRLRQVRVWYDDGPAGEEVCTRLSPYRVALRDGRWHTVGRSTYHRRVVVIALSRVTRVAPTDEPYAIPPRFDLGRFLGQAWGVHRGPTRTRVTLRFDRPVAHEVTGRSWHRSQRLEPLADGRVNAHYVVDGTEEIARWVLGFGDGVEVLTPHTLRAQVRELAERVALRHAGRPSPAPERYRSPNQGGVGS